jgi:hypothetical protein
VLAQIPLFSGKGDDSMRVFISYARRDLDAVEQLRADLARSNVETWFDRELEGGEKWWATILDQVKSCDLFVVALSPDSVASRACRAEFDYAKALDRPFLPVMVRPVNVALAPDPIGETQVVDYCERTPESAINLIVAVQQTRPVPLPTPIPPAPPAPMSALGPLRDRLATPVLSYEDQLVVLADLKRHVDNRDEHEPLIALLQQLRGRSDVAESVGREVDALMARIPIEVDDDSAPVRRRASAVDRGDLDLLRSIAAHLKASHCTPVLGVGLTDSLIGSRRLIARQWAKAFEFPMARHQRDDLAEVAQFVAVMTNTDTLIGSLREYLTERVQTRYPQVDVSNGLGEALRQAWLAERSDADPHTILARLPVPVYVTAHPFDLLAEALRLEGKEPTVELCRWKPALDWPPSAFETEPEYEPSAQRPLVYHVFGRIDVPDSLVLTEDDYFQFLIGVTRERSLIPAVVRRSLADSALLLLGFGLQDWDTRALLATLMNQQGAHKLHRYTHVAAQIDLASTVMSPARAERYLERYFGKYRQPSIDIFWGSVEDFASELSTVWEGTR